MSLSWICISINLASRSIRRVATAHAASFCTLTLHLHKSHHSKLKTATQNDQSKSKMTPATDILHDEENKGQEVALSSSPIENEMAANHPEEEEPDAGEPERPSGRTNLNRGCRFSRNQALAALVAAAVANHPEPEVEEEDEEHLSLSSADKRRSTSRCRTFSLAALIATLLAIAVAAGAGSVVHPAASSNTNISSSEQAVVETIEGYDPVGPGSCQDSVGNTYSMVGFRGGVNSAFECSGKCTCAQSDGLGNTFPFRGISYNPASPGYCNCFFDSDVSDDVFQQVKSSCSANSEYTGRGIGDIVGSSGKVGHFCYKLSGGGSKAGKKAKAG